MRTSKTLLVTTGFLFAQFIFSQNIPQLTEKDSIVKSTWIFGLGFNAVDDAGSEFLDVFNFKDNWNVVPFPSRLSIGRYFESGFGLEAIASYNRYQTGKIADDVVITDPIDYYAFDVRASYDLNQILGETGFFDPYVGIGLGYTDANNRGRGTYNATVGFRAWFTNRFGLDINSTGKWAMKTEVGVTNHLQHALGAVYRFGTEKGLSKKGEEKLALIQEMEQEQQRVNDSIAEAQRAEEEARLLAQELERQKENERLAAEEKAQREAENTQKTKLLNLQNQIDGLGKVYFSYNSSFLSVSDKKLLDKLILILQENPDLKIEVSGHSDARGSEKYNLWLSERRMVRTVEYLIAKGVPQSQIVKAALGETQLVNDCGDGVPCSEAKHKKNRRSQFRIVSD
jgi:outer membrane protein OmpA-like peptidoglycan-associated protein